jgi:predicted phage tail protein
MSKAIAEIAVGVALVALDIVAPYIGIHLTVAWIASIASTGASLILGGIGTLLTKQMTGLSASVRNPIQPRNVIYGQALIGGTVVFLLETGESDKYLHTIYVLACHPCQSIDAVMFDGKRLPLDGDGNSISF